jgi:uncharacterized protein with HEPN domain
MVDAARKIQLYIEGLSFADFTNDDKTFDAVIRQLTVIGEAASHVPDEIASREPNIPWSVIRGMRNIVVHEYFGVDAGIIWKTVVRNIPELRSQVEKLQQKLSQEEQTDGP